MSYSFLDGSGTIQTADSSVVSGVVQRPVLQIGSILSTVPVSFPNPPGTPLYYVGSVVSGSVTAMFTSVAGMRNYLTNLVVANTGSVATLLTLKDGSTSVLGFVETPASNGSIPTFGIPLRAAPAQDFSFSVAPSSSVLYVTAQGYQAP
jgi:hypothetical protein